MHTLITSTRQAKLALGLCWLAFSNSMSRLYIRYITLLLCTVVALRLSGKLYSEMVHACHGMTSTPRRASITRSKVQAQVQLWAWALDVGTVPGKHPVLLHSIVHKPLQLANQALS
jgi:hypothetical protein